MTTIKRGLKGPKGDRGEKGDHGQDGKNGANGIVTPDIYEKLGALQQGMKSNEEFHRNLLVDLKADREHRDKQHTELFQAISDIRKNCSAREGCSRQVTVNTERLDALDSIENGAVPKLQQDMSSVKTKAGGIAAIIGVVVSVIMGVIGWFVTHLSSTPPVAGQ